MYKSNYKTKSTRFEAAPDLPKEVQLPHELELDGCPWLDSYVAFSQEWSPRSFDGYHEAIGLWILSTVAARRVSVVFGGERYTNLYILLVGRTSLYAKTTVVKIAKELLSNIELDYLLLPDEITPQRMLVEMASKLPDNWETSNATQKEEHRKILAFAGQRGWYYDEFGQNIQNMMKRDGPYMEFRSILRKLDDTGPAYEKSTISRGKESVLRPYLALLGALTPADLAPAVFAGSILWGDGYLARMGLVVPPTGLVKDGKFPQGERVFPSELTEPILRWHERLGIPTVKIVEGQLVDDTNGPVSKLEPSEEVIEAYYRYDGGLRNMLSQMSTPDFDGNYARFPEKALRIATLFASIEGCSALELRHWAKAQGITERWRSNLHSLYKQVNAEEFQHQEWTDEQKVMKAIREKGSPTSREIQQYTGIKAVLASRILEDLTTTGKVIVEESGRTTRYQLASSSKRSSDPITQSEEFSNQYFDQFEGQFDEDHELALDEHHEPMME